jgi:uncharacterized protein YbjT (DUF2867 family)
MRAVRVSWIKALGAAGQIGQELARSLESDFTGDIRLVSRNPLKVNDTVNCIEPICST